MANAPLKYLNKVMLKGRLGKDPEIRYMPSGDPVCNFSLATRSGKHVEWHKIVAYEAVAVYIHTGYKTGDFVYVEAEIRTREFLTAEDRAAGRKPRKVTELIVQETHLLARNAGEEDEELAAPTDADAPKSDNGDTTLPKFV